MLVKSEVNFNNKMIRHKVLCSRAATCINMNGEIILIKDNKAVLSPTFFSASPELQKFEEGCRKLFKTHPKHAFR